MKVKRLNETLIDIAGTGFPLCRCHKGASINLLSQVNGASFTRARVRGVKHMNLLSPHPRFGEGGFIHLGEGITNFADSVVHYESTLHALIRSERELDRTDGRGGKRQDLTPFSVHFLFTFSV